MSASIAVREIIIDNFAGGGGVSTGIEQATGVPVDAAINHDPLAIAMHKANHPETTHYCESVWDVHPEDITKGRPVALCWLSPDCKHFSKAKGAKPVKKEIRGLAWIAIRYAATVRPRVIILENVEEFLTWGPLTPKLDPKTGRMLKIIRGNEDEDGEIVVSEPGENVPYEERYIIPDPNQKGRTFNSFVNALKRYGYKVEWKILRACDYGAPTSRRRLFLIARCDGQSIVWPDPTHGDPSSTEVLQGEIQPWRTAAEIIDWSIPVTSIFERKKPLVPNTMRRIAKGLQKFIIDNDNPYIAPIQVEGINDNSHLVTAFLAQYHSETTKSDVRGQTLDRPLLTLDTSNRYALVTSHLVKLRGTNVGHPVTDPLQTITAGGNHFGEVRAFLIAYYGTSVGSKLTDPLQTITTHERFGIVYVHGSAYQIIDIGMRMLEPHELFAGQGFPKNYIIKVDVAGNPCPKSVQTARCGNSVAPNMAEALTRGNLPELCTGSGNTLTFERYSNKSELGQMKFSM